MFDHKRFSDWLERVAMPAAGIESKAELARPHHRRDPPVGGDV